MVARVRGTHIASGSTDTWNGKMLKIPPVTPSILDCCIIRVDYSLAVSQLLPSQGGGGRRGAQSHVAMYASRTWEEVLLGQQRYDGSWTVWKPAFAFKQKLPP